MLSVLIALSFVTCKMEDKKAPEVVVYTSLDQTFSEPVLKMFEKNTGIEVKPVYDTEASKTTGMVNRLIAEKSYPRADVFWNSETGHTIRLKNRGVLARYVSPSASDIPPTFKDREGYWTGFAARCRVLIYNTDLVSHDEAPESIFDFTEPEWKGEFTLAYPLFGTTATHAAALFVHLGDEKAKEYFRSLKDNGAVIVDGNSTSRDRVAAGDYRAGFTDTDDANVALEKGAPAGIVFPDADSMGTLLIPNTAALVKGGPNPEQGKAFLDFVLSREVEAKLAAMPGAQIPVREGVPVPDGIKAWGDIKYMEVDFEKVAAKMDESASFLKELFVR